MSYRLLIRAAAAGALLGALVGAAFGLAEIRANHDLVHGTPWLAAMRALSAMRLTALSGGTASIALLLLLGARPSRRPGTRIVGAAMLTALGAGLSLLFSGAWAQRLQTVTHAGRYGTLVLATLVGTMTALLAVHALPRLREVPARMAAFRDRLATPVGCAVLLILLAAPGPFRRLRAAESAPDRSVILVSIDTLRADRVGPSASGTTLTPRLDALSREGASFMQATAPAPWTQPSHASLFTSLLPFDQRGKAGRHRIRPGLSTLAERFRDAGYRTGAFTGGGAVHQQFGFSQGFEVYESHDEIEEGGPQGILAAALQWLRHARPQPFFLFVHTYEPHAPYTHGGRADPRHAGRIGDAFDYDDLDAVREQRLVLTDEEQAYVQDLYDGDVAFVDRLIGEFLQQAEELAPPAATIVMVVSDHGEDFWDHVPERSADHGHSLYEELLRVPLIIRAPGLVPAGVRIRTPVSLLDVAPTLLSLSGIRPDQQHHGRDLAGVLRSGGEPPLVPVSAESVHYGPDRFSVRHGDLKLIVAPYPEFANSDVHLSVAPLEVFDLEVDPGETTNLAVSLGPVPAELGPLLARALRFAGTPSEKSSDSFEDIPRPLRDQLRALGYVK